MIMVAALIASQVAVAQPRENPVTPVEWLDHYAYCLQVNFDAVLASSPTPGRVEAARRATGRCWPVQAGARGKVITDLENGRSRLDANERQELAERMTAIVASAFALSVGVTSADLGSLSPP